MQISPEQLAVCRRFQSDAVQADAESNVGIALDSLHLQPLNALRLKQENGTCGWYIYGGQSSEDPNFYQPLHVIHLVEYCPRIIPYLALAPGWRVLLAKDYVDVWFDKEIVK